MAKNEEARPLMKRTEETKMTGFRTIARRGVCTMFVAAALLLSPVGQESALAAAASQTHFASPEEAAKALVTAAKAHDRKATLAMLGDHAEPLLDSGDSVADAAARDSFIAAADVVYSVVKDGDAKAVIEVGKDQWPFPIPLVKEEAGWRFDTQAGFEELLNRRIGRNEVSAVQVCLAYADAQREYYSSNPTGSKLLHYAQKVRSDPGKRNGLFWETKEGEEPSPIGPLVVGARAEGYKKRPAGERTPYHGYLYKILTAQGADAPGGAYDYIAKGEMIGGFALVAYPAEYGVSGVMTFLINHDGVVYEKDLGLKTDATALAMKTFNPDSTWKKTDTTVVAGE